jgi:hypothetical protein
MKAKPTIPQPTPLEQIQKLQAQIAGLQGAAVVELKSRREAILVEIKAVNADLEGLTGKSTNRRTPAVLSVTFQELKERLEAAPNRTLNIRRMGLDTTNVRTLANLHPKELELGGKGAWPTVFLV